MRGSIAAISAAASARDGTRLPRLPKAMAPMYTVPITAARIADGDAPDNSVYSQIAASGARR